MISDIQILKIDHKQSLTNIKFSEAGHSTFLITADFIPEVKSSSIDLVFSPDSSKFTERFWLREETQTLTVQKTEKIESEKIESGKKNGALISGLNTYAGGTAEVASLGLSFVNIDASGQMMKFT